MNAWYICKEQKHKRIQCESCRQYFHPSCAGYSRYRPTIQCCNALEWKTKYRPNIGEYRSERSRMPVVEGHKKFKSSIHRANHSGLQDDTSRINEFFQCHRCSVKQEYSNQIQCSKCKESFCITCLTNRYKIERETNVSANQFMQSNLGHWICFVCMDQWNCQKCRKIKSSKKAEQTKVIQKVLQICHTCQQKAHCQSCPACQRTFWYDCFPYEYPLCIVCQARCDCEACIDTVFQKDARSIFEKTKGIDLRKRYPQDLQNIFQVEGFWVRALKRENDNQPT